MNVGDRRLFEDKRRGLPSRRGANQKEQRARGSDDDGPHRANRSNDHHAVHRSRIRSLKAEA
jgi:hypothetical protein